MQVIKMLILIINLICFTLYWKFQDIDERISDTALLIQTIGVIILIFI